MEQPRSLDLAFGWAESPTDHLWHFGEAANAEGSASSAPTFHARCGQMYLPSKQVAEQPPADAAICEDCRPAS